MGLYKVIFVCLSFGTHVWLTSSFQGRIPIGAIFDLDDEASKTGFLFAVSRFNERPDENFQFSGIIDVIDVKDSFELAKSICSHLSTGVFILFGTQKFKSCDIAQAFTHTFQVPYVSPSLSDVCGRSLTDFRLHMKPRHSKALADTIRHFRWRMFHYVYDSEEGLYSLQEIMKSLQLHKYTVRVRLRQIQNVNQAHEDLRALDKQSPDPESDSLAEKYIVLNLSTESAYEEILKQGVLLCKWFVISPVISQIREVGMNKHGYNYILGSMDFLSLGMERYRHGGVNITGFQLVNYSSHFVKNFMTVWRTLDPKVWPGAHEHSIHVEAALAVDSITVIQKTISKMVERSSSIFQHTFRRGDIYNYNKTKGVPCSANPPIPWMHGQSLMTGMTELRFDGVTGNIGFDRYGFRKDYTFDVFNVGLDEGPNKIGGWSSNYGFTADRAEEHNDVKIVSNTSKVYIVTSIPAEPFLMVKKPKKGGKPYLDNDRYEGYCVDMTQEVAKFIGFDYRIELVHDNMFGKKMDNGSWNGMIRELLDNKADLAVAPLTITMEREKEVHFSKPFMNVGISIMIKKPEKKKPGVFSFMQPFTLELWLAIVISYFVVGAVVFLVCRISHEEWQRPLRFGQQRFNIFTLPNSLWFTMGSLMLQGSDDTCPRSTSGRIVGGAWWSVVLICISSYTANLAAFLTIEKLLTPIESADDLVKQSEIAYGTLNSGSTEEFFIKSHVPTYKAMSNYMQTAHPSVFVSTIEEGINRVQNSKGKYAFLLESVYNEYANSRKPCDTMRVGPNLNSNSYGIATTKTSILRDEVTYAVLSLTEDGTLLKLKKKWWVDKGECGFDTGHRESKKKSLSLSNVAGVYFILITGLVMSIIIGVVEFIFNKRRPDKNGLIYMMPADTVVTLIEGNHVNHIDGENGTIPPPVRKENHTNSITDNEIKTPAVLHNAPLQSPKDCIL